MTRRTRTLNTRGIPARILDLLETDSGWLTADGIAHALSVNPDSVHRALYRLRGRGLVENRRVELAGVPRNPAGYAWADPCGSRTEYRAEWRFVTWGEWTE